MPSTHQEQVYSPGGGGGDVVIDKALKEFQENAHVPDCMVWKDIKDKPELYRYVKQYDANARREVVKKEPYHPKPFNRAPELGKPRQFVPEEERTEFNFKPKKTEPGVADSMIWWPTAQNVVTRLYEKSAGRNQVGVWKEEPSHDHQNHHLGDHGDHHHGDHHPGDHHPGNQHGDHHNGDHHHGDHHHGDPHNGDHHHGDHHHDDHHDHGKNHEKSQGTGAHGSSTGDHKGCKSHHNNGRDSRSSSSSSSRSSSSSSSEHNHRQKTRHPREHRPTNMTDLMNHTYMREKEARDAAKLQERHLSASAVRKSRRTIRDTKSNILRSEYIANMTPKEIYYHVDEDEGHRRRSGGSRGGDGRRGSGTRGEENGQRHHGHPGSGNLHHGHHGHHDDQHGHHGHHDDHHGHHGHSDDHHGHNGHQDDHHDHHGHHDDHHGHHAPHDDHHGHHGKHDDHHELHDQHNDHRGRQLNKGGCKRCDSSVERRYYGTPRSASDHMRRSSARSASRERKPLPNKYVVTGPQVRFG